MKKLFFIRLWACLYLALAASVSGWAQTSLTELTIEYNKTYQIDAGYSIIYDNPGQLAKLNEFKIEFYAPDKSKLGTTQKETYPLTETTKIYALAEPMIGFQSAKLIVLSLHAGDISDFPSNANSVLALNELTEVPDAPPPPPLPTNNPPSAQNTSFQIEASLDTLTENISGSYSDPDGDAVTVTPKSASAPPFAYTLESNGDLNLNAPSTVGNYDVSYEVRDSKGAKATAQITVEVTRPPSIETALADYQQSLEALQDLITNKEAEISASAPSAELMAELNRLLQDNLALSETAHDSKFAEQKLEIDALSQTLTNSKNAEGPSEELEVLKTQFLTLQNTLQGLQSSSTEDGVTLETLQAKLTQFGSDSSALNSDVNALNTSASLTTAQIATWKQTHLELKKIIDGSLNITLLIAILIGAILLTLAAWRFLRRPKFGSGIGETLQNQSFQRALPERVQPSGVVFPGSPMQAANVATPLSPAGQLTASNLQMLNGPYQVLRPAYHATGRLGFAQEGIPSLEDYSFGTGFLISPLHVMTNRHVHGLYGHYLTGEDSGGIEFIAEKDKDASDFIPFDGQPPKLISGLDIAIYTLSQPAKGRTPVVLSGVQTNTLDGQEIAVIGYPDTHTPNDPDICAVVEENPVFAVKRISQGIIFRHSTDTDKPYGVQASVDEDDRTKFDMPAICHNASTLGGNSGSPILDIHTGELRGVHFAGFKVFNKKEAANLAMTIAQLLESKEIKIE